MVDLEGSHPPLSSCALMAAQVVVASLSGGTDKLGTPKPSGFAHRDVLQLTLYRTCTIETIHPLSMLISSLDFILCCYLV